MVCFSLLYQQYWIHCKDLRFVMDRGLPLVNRIDHTCLKANNMVGFVVLNTIKILKFRTQVAKHYFLNACHGSNLKWNSPKRTLVSSVKMKLAFVSSTCWISSIKTKAAALIALPCHYYRYPLFFTTIVMLIKTTIVT